MDDNLPISYWRWQTAEDSDRDDDADAACRVVFERAISESAISPQFTTRTLEAIAAAAARDARLARRARAAVICAGVAGLSVAAYFGAGFVAGMTSAAFVNLLNLLVGAAVRIAEGFGTGMSLWSVLSSIGRAGAALVADPTITFAIVIIQGVAISALIALQRLLGSDEESFE